ncbi:hypothetical protein CALCODRAFT_304218 [Calocera cornea HHB12733]|uniref:Uncharacterized protein n=1 Tax=Calocera cornea HHB12733 TaxID=1353952 RepID=A0A165JL25_9BASI|nr:hypothetical protein CALCODRAFT_304218 [Calocera cornea HHB12733]
MATPLSFQRNGQRISILNPLHEQPYYPSTDAHSEHGTLSPVNSAREDSPTPRGTDSSPHLRLWQLTENRADQKIASVRRMPQVLHHFRTSHRPSPSTLVPNVTLIHTTFFRLSSCRGTHASTQASSRTYAPTRAATRTAAGSITSSSSAYPSPYCRPQRILTDNPATVSICRRRTEAGVTPTSARACSTSPCPWPCPRLTKATCRSNGPYPRASRASPSTRMRTLCAGRPEPPPALRPTSG